VVDIELWTSGTDRGYDGNYVWCSSKNFLNTKEVNWKSGQPKTADGHCMFVQFSNKSANQTFVSMGDCSQKRKFICQVKSVIFLHLLIKNNYYLIDQKSMALSEGDLMQAECMSLYDLTDGILTINIDTNY
jgi:hypothetical protein